MSINANNSGDVQQQQIYLRDEDPRIEYLKIKNYYSNLFSICLCKLIFFLFVRTLKSKPNQ